MALSRLAGLTLQANIGIPYSAIQTEIGHLVAYVVQISRRASLRRITELLTAIAAIAVPARRAATVDPVIALREE